MNSNSAQWNFNKATFDEANSLGAKYDYYSVMHYDEYKFSENGNPTITALSTGDGISEDVEEEEDDPMHSIGQRIGASKMDILQIRLIYQCEPSLESSSESKVGGLINPRTLDQFRSSRCNITAGCKCGLNFVGCKNDDDCKGNLICNTTLVKPKCKRPPKG